MKGKPMKINEDILRNVKDNCGEDAVLEVLLRNLIIEESFHERSWKWKEEYDKKISKCLEEWKNED